MKRFNILFILLMLGALTSHAQQWQPIQTRDGLVQGVFENGQQVFKGIPFAAPPTGQNRWKAPQAAEKWQGVKMATQYGPSPYQGGNPTAGKSEDCLYLNIWSPAKLATEKLPVLVWIYGGGFSFGSTAEPVYTGEKLAGKGVIVVSIAYRVGQLGFLAHPELSAESMKVLDTYYTWRRTAEGKAWAK